MENISVFDADACIMMGIPLKTGQSLLSEMIQYFDYCYIHKTVYDEVGTGYGQKAHLMDLVNQGLVELIDDELLLDKLFKSLKNEEAVCNYFRESLNKNINRMKPREKGILSNIYNSILRNTYSLKSKLIDDLNSVESQMPKGSSPGELKTCILVDVLDFLDIAEVNFFVSNDKRARLLMIDSSSGKVSTSSPMATFILLKEAGMQEELARKYLKKLGKKRLIHIIDASNTTVTKRYSEVFNDIYGSEYNVILTADGMMQYQKNE